MDLSYPLFYMEKQTKIFIVGGILVITILSIIIFRRRIPKLIWPVTGRITSEFGEKRSTGTHTGIDIAAPTGTPILAPADGTIERTFSNSIGGNQIIIEHAAGLKTGYAHLSTTDVKPGQRVRRGQQIGRVGNTGRSTGPHLHFSVTLLGIRQNPRDFIV